MTTAAAAKSLQLNPTLCDPTDGSPPGFPIPGILQARTLEFQPTGVGYHFLLQCMKVKSESEVAQSCPTLHDPMDCSPPGSSIQEIFPGKSTGVGCHCLLRSVTTRKTMTLTMWNFVSKVMSLLFNTLSRFLIAFLPRNNCLLISWLQLSSGVIFKAQEKEICHCFHFFPSICHEVMRLDAMILVCLFFVLIFSFKLDFSLFSFTSSRGSLVRLCFLTLEWNHPHI